MNEVVPSEKRKQKRAQYTVLVTVLHRVKAARMDSLHR